MTHPWEASGRNPTQPKKWVKNELSCRPTKPVAGEALSLHLHGGVGSKTGRRSKSVTRRRGGGARRMLAPPFVFAVEDTPT